MKTGVRNLRIYITALDLTKQIYELVCTHREISSDFSLSDQLKRAAVSVAANISEGYFRTQNQAINYLRISSGSTNEVITHLEIVSLVYKINTEQLQSNYSLLGKQINAYLKSIK